MTCGSASTALRSPLRAIANLQGIPLLSGEGNEKLLIRLPNDTYKLFTREILENGERHMTLALDVTDLALANRNLWRANLDLKDATEAIREQMSLVGLVAEGEAHLKMRARVHDVVGQRLSIHPPLPRRTAHRQHLRRGAQGAHRHGHE